MRTIVKTTEPLTFASWKSKGKTQKTYADLGNFPEIKQKLKEALIQEQHQLCCYCESPIDLDSSHIEHFFPQSSGSRQLDYENLHASCNGGRYKQRHCGSLKDHWYDSNLTLSPLNPATSQRFAFTENGLMLAREESDLGASTTIQKLGLNVEKLKSQRAAAIEGAQAILDSELKNLSDSEYFAHFEAIIEDHKQSVCLNPPQPFISAILDFLIKRFEEDKELQN